MTIVECPRDAWQGLRQMIPTEEKVKYLSSLVSLGFRHIDAVSFVSPKHVPQMADSEAVMNELSRVKSPSGEAPDIIGIVVNAQGLERALATPGVTTVGYPYSISAYFRRANANMSRAESRRFGAEDSAGYESSREKVGGVYFDGVRESLRRALGAGNRRGNVVWLKDIGVRTISLADTVGTASPNDVAAVYNAVESCVAGVEIGVHLHSRPDARGGKGASGLRSGLPAI